MHHRIQRLHELDFEVVAARCFHGDELEQVYFALDMARYAHRGQPRRDSGKEAISHPVSAATTMTELVRRWDYVSLMLLHDVFEDSRHLTREDVARIRETLGSDIVDDMHALSKRYASDVVERPVRAGAGDYYRNLSHASRRVQLVKFCDRFDNLSDMEKCAPDKRARQRRTTHDHFIPMAQAMLRGMDRTDEMRHAVAFLLAEFERLCKG